MTKTQYALAYSRCNNAELRHFIADRGLIVRWTTRKAGIKALRTADREATFNFFDLSPELRNEVYWYLLTLTKKSQHSQKKVCFPGILCASHQIHSEARGILYAAENEITIALTIRSGTMFLNHHTFSISINDHPTGNVRSWGPSECAATFPSTLLNFTRLRLVIDFDPQRALGPANQGPRRLNHMLYALTNILRGGKQLKHLSIEVDSLWPQLPAHADSLDYSLNHLAGDWKCTFNFIHQNEQSEYEPQETSSDFGPYGGDLVRNAQHFEDVIGKILDSSGDQRPVRVPRAKMLRSALSRLGSLLNWQGMVRDHEDGNLRIAVLTARDEVRRFESVS